MKKYMIIAGVFFMVSGLCSIVMEYLSSSSWKILWWFSNNTLFLGGIFLILAGYKSK